MKINKTAQLILAVTFAVVIQLAVAHYDEWLPHSWQTYTASDRSFSVDLPAKPTFDTVQAPGAGGMQVSIQMVTAQPTQDTAYMCSYYDRVDDPESTPQEVLETSRDGSLNKIQGSLISQKNMTIQGYPAIDVQAHARQDSLVDLRLILVNKRLFMLMAIAPNGKREPKAVKRFFDSFKLHKQS